MALLGVVAYIGFTVSTNTLNDLVEAQPELVFVAVHIITPEFAEFMTTEWFKMGVKDVEDQVYVKLGLFVDKVRFGWEQVIVWMLELGCKENIAGAGGG